MMTTRGAAIDRLVSAVVGGDGKQITEALDGLAQDIIGTVQQRIKRATTRLWQWQDADRKRIAELERQIELMQRHLQMADRILEEQAKTIDALLGERAVGE